MSLKTLFKGLIYISIPIFIFNSKVFSQPDSTFDVQKYELNLDIYSCFKTPFPHSFNSTEVITVKANEPVSQIILNAVNSSLTIQSVSGAGISFSNQNDLLTINLDSVYYPGGEFEIVIDYQHKDIKDSAFYVRDGMVFTDCEASGARKWFPCKDVPSDKALLSLTARVPSGVLLGSNGMLVDSSVFQDTVSYKWVSEHPVATYLIAIAGKVKYNLDVINWTRPTGENMDIRLYWQHGETNFNISNIKNKVGLMLDLFSGKYCDYPFEKLGYATTNKDFPWGGMENQTFITLCPDCWTEDLISHELAHQWFGDMITPMTWSDIWLNEGFATFSEALWKERQYGYAAYKKNILAEAAKYLRKNPGWAIYQKSWDVSKPDDDVIFNEEISYSKAGCVLHLLRYVLGDSVFFNCIKSYASDPDFQYANATTEQFINLVNEVSGQDMNWFFDEWIYKPNHPVYQNNKNIEKESDGNWKVDYTINQIQTNTEFFKMPVELKITFANDQDTTFKVNDDYNLETFSFEFNEEPKYIVFDPDNQIVLKEVKN